MLVLPQVVLLPAAAALARRAGWRRGADWLGSRQLLRETDVARENAWLVHTELLRLPYRQGRRESARDALAEEVFGDPRTEAADRGVLKELARRTSDAAFRRDLEDKLAAYRLSRSAVAELCTAIVSVAIGAAAFRQLTFGVMSLGPALAHERHAIESFPLGSWLGGLWYGVFPATPSWLATIGAMAGLASRSACSRRSRVSSPIRCSVASAGIGGCWIGSSPPSDIACAAATRAGSRSAITGLPGFSTSSTCFERLGASSAESGRRRPWGVQDERWWRRVSALDDRPGPKRRELIRGSWRS